MFWTRRRPCSCDGCTRRIIAQRAEREAVAAAFDMLEQEGAHLIEFPATIDWDDPAYRCQRIPPYQTLADAVRERAQ
jgi:hypothetical protein